MTPPAARRVAAPTAGAAAREERQQRDAEADLVVEAYEAAAGCKMPNGERVALRAQAAELLAVGRPAEWLAARAAEMPAKGWVDLVKHAQVSLARVPLPGQQSAERPPNGLPLWCGKCGDGGLNQAARVAARWRTLGNGGTGELCPDCHPERVLVGA
ncbi:hypothetical protein [Streptomyces sp. NPDC057909]|uniref:hypothetical protein n=1 Tax=Streptomyces sp. NPDC057909 TaxID=3346277 RepID=UPI0036E3E341